MIRFLARFRHEAEIISGIRCNVAADDHRHLARVIAPAGSIHEPALHAAHSSEDPRSNARRIPSSCRSALPSRRKLDHAEALVFPRRLAQESGRTIQDRALDDVVVGMRQYEYDPNSPVLRVQLPLHFEALHRSHAHSTRRPKRFEPRHFGLRRTSGIVRRASPRLPAP